MSARSMAAVAALVALLQATAEAEFEVTPDKENVVASRLPGIWTADAASTERLTGRRPSGRSGRGTVEFSVDAKVAKAVPEKYAQFLKGRKIYIAGRMKRGRGEHPFILIEHRGNPHVVWFRERGGDPMGDAESFNVMLVRAGKEENDLLFIGGDFNNQAFSAYRRWVRGVGLEPKTAGAAKWLKAVKTGDAGLLEAAYTARLRNSLSAKGWKVLVKEGRQALREEDGLGEYEMKDFSYSFEGSDKKGRVHIRFRGRHTDLSFAVRLEDGEWRVDEH